jgi:hypothetical protein
MRCDDFLPIIEKLADGECSAAEERRARGHLETCDACREHYEFLEALPEAARKAPLTEPPGAYWEALPSKVMRRIDQEQSSKRSLGWFPAWLAPSQLRWLAVVAAGLVVVVLSYEVMMVQDTRAPVPDIPASSGRVTQDDKDVPETFEAVSKEIMEQEKREADEVPRQETEGVGSAASSEDRLRAEEPPARENLPAKADEQALRRDRPVESPASVPVPREGEAESGIAAFADEEAAVLEEAVGKKAALSPAEPSDVVADSPQKPQAVSGEESTVLSAQTEPSPTPARGRAKLEANQAKAVDRMAVADRAQKASYRRTLGGARELSEIETEAHCNHLRESLEQGLDGEELLNARFDLAECSLSLAKWSPTEERLQRAREDVDAFLEISPKGDKADKLKRELALFKK